MPTDDNWQAPLSFDEVAKKYGEWTAMSIHLGDGQYTIMPPVVDHRLRRLVQIVSDLAGKPLNQLRVLDLACLEGHYGLEFALHGAEVVGLDIRDANLAKAQFAKAHLRLDNLKLYHADVRNLSKEKYGVFDVVLCAGILYHIDAAHIFSFVKSIFEVCGHFVIFDTFISLKARDSVRFEGETYYGMNAFEHEKNTTDEEKLRNAWASADNEHSFWLTQPSLFNLLEDVGFSSFFECHFPVCSIGHIDRKTYVAVKGRTVNVLSSPVTNHASRLEIPENPKIQFNPGQTPPSFLFQFFKERFPQPLKNFIKPILRSLKIMGSDATHPHLKKYLKENKSKRSSP